MSKPSETETDALPASRIRSIAASASTSDLPNRSRRSERAGVLLDLQLNERAYVLSFVATIFVPLTFVTGFFGMSFCWLIDQIDSPIAFWLLGFVAPIAAGALSWRLWFAVSYGATAVEARSAASAAATRALLPGGEAVEGSATLICSSARLVGMT